MAIEPELLNEGKTKKIWRYPLSTYEVSIESKDAVTAGDGTKRIQLKGKGAYSTETTANCFEFLRKCNIPNHFVKREGERTFRALELHMIPIEVVIRRVATGTYTKRNPSVKEGTRFTWPLIEFFDKADAMHDPLLIHDLVSCRILRYDAKLPINLGFIDERPVESRGEAMFLIEKLTSIGERVFITLEKAWATLNVTLCDLKIECGRNTTVIDSIMLGDTITNDEWRLWPDGDKSRELSKQVFRDMAIVTPENLRKLEANYALVAEMTRKF